MAGYIYSTQEKKSTIKITVPRKDLIQTDGEIKSFSDKQKVREFSTTKPALQCVKGTYIVRKYKRRKQIYKIDLKQFKNGNESESEVAQSCPTLYDPMDGSLHQAPPSMGFSRQEVLKWVAISFSMESSQPRDRTQVSRIVDRHFTV